MTEFGVRVAILSFVEKLQAGLNYDSDPEFR